MAGGVRVTALKGISAPEWSMGNPIFKSDVAAFDAAFIAERFVPPKHYILREIGDSDTAEEYVSRILFSNHRGSKHYIIKATLGRGKTQFCNYIAEKILKERYPKFIYVNINCFDRINDYTGDIRSIEKDIIEGVIDSVLSNSNFNIKSRIDLGKAIYKFRTRGNIIRSPEKALAEVDKVELRTMVKFILSPEFSNCLVDDDLLRIRCLIVIDNIDECTAISLSNVINLSQRITEYGAEAGKHGFLRVVIPMREYTVVATRTENYPNYSLPDIDIAKMLIQRLHQLNDYLLNNSRKVEVGVASTFGRGRSSKGMYATFKIQNPEVIIEPLIKKVSSHDSGVWNDFINKLNLLSGGNYKQVIRNFYYILHSCKLVISPLVEYAHTHPDSHEFAELRRKLDDFPFSSAVIFDFLMAIHYPFFDAENSLIPNLFNIKHSVRAFGFRKTLVQSRILGYIFNRKITNLNEIKAIFSRYGFDFDVYVAPAINNLLNHGLLDPSIGVSVESVSGDSNIKLTESGVYYITHVLFDKRYWIYVFDDVEMPSELIVPIENRYEKGKAKAKSTKDRDIFLKNCIEFIRIEEKNEELFIKERGNNFANYRNTFFIRGVSLYEDVLRSFSQIS